MNGEVMVATMQVSQALSVNTHWPGRVAAMMGLEANSLVELSAQIDAGLSTAVADRLSDLIGRQQVIQHLIPRSTLMRKSKNNLPLSTDESERLFAMSKALDAINMAYAGDTKKTEIFMHRVHPLLNNRTPFEMAASSVVGSEAVVQLMQQTRAGMPL